MFKKFSILSLIAGLLFLGSCADKEKSPILTFDKVGKGAYVRLVEESGGFLVNLFEPNNTSYTYTVEFVDLEKGALVSEYRIEMTYVDNNPSNGDNTSAATVWKTFSSGEFETNERGFKGVSNITVTSADLFGTTGVSDPSTLMPGDQFQVRGFIVTNDGSTFGAANSSAAVNGDAFKGHFNFTFNATCPSSLAGTYSAVGSEFVWCPDNYTGPIDFEVDIIETGAGVYTFSEWSFGAYRVCYGGDGTSWGELQFKDVCAKVSFTGFVDAFGDTWEFTSSIDGAEWTIEWVNTYGESGKAVIMYPDGDWPIAF